MAMKLDAIRVVEHAKESGLQVRIIPEKDFDFNQNYHPLESLFREYGIVNYDFGEPTTADTDLPETFEIDLREAKLIYPKRS